MSSITLKLFLLFLLSGYSSSEVKVVNRNNPQTSTVNINIGKSIIYWKGTKMMHTGMHEGTIRFREGELLLDENKLTGGYFRVDMGSLLITDIPPHETTAIRNITNHLKSDFDTQHFPFSKFEIVSVEYLNDTLSCIGGNMTIRGITNYITINASYRTEQSTPYFYSDFIIDRTHWNIGSEGSWLEKKLVDDEIEFRIKIVTDK